MQNYYYAQFGGTHTLICCFYGQEKFEESTFGNASIILFDIQFKGIYTTIGIRENHISQY